MLVSAIGVNDLAAGDLKTQSAVASSDPVASVEARPVTDILVVLDATASMQYGTGSAQGASRLDLARILTSSVLDSAPAGINLGVLTLRDDVSELRPLGPMAAADRTQIRRGVETLASFGEGNLVACFQRIIDRLDPASSPLVVMVTDGQDLNPDAANLAAGKLHDAFAGRLRFVLVGICKHGAVADRLQALATFAGGDSISLTSENDIPTGLASVREACDEVRRHRLSMLERLKGDYQLAVKELARVNDEFKQCQETNGQLIAKLEVVRNAEQLLKDEVAGKGLQIAEQSGQITQLKTQVDTLEKNWAAAKVELGEKTRQQVEVEEWLAKEKQTNQELLKSSTADKNRLKELEDAQLISNEEKEALKGELQVFQESWIAPFVDWSAAVGGLLGALFLMGGPGASMITTRLLGGQLGMAIGEKGEHVSRSVTETISQKLADQRKEAIADLKATEQMIEKRVTELASVQFEKTLQKIEEARNLQQDADRKLDEIRGVTAGQLSRVTEVVSQSLGKVEDKLARTEEKLLAGQTQILDYESAAQADRQQNVAALQASIAHQTTVQTALIKENSAGVNGQFQEATRVSAERFEATRSWAEGTREVISRIGQQVEQLPMRLESVGSQLSATITQEMRQQLTTVQITVQSVRDQIDQVRHEFESGLHDSERRQVEHSGRTEQLSKELARLASMSDDMVRSIQSETASIADEVKDVTNGMSGPLTRIESQLQSVIREFDLLRNVRPDESGFVAELKCQLQHLQQTVELLRGGRSFEPDVWRSNSVSNAASTFKTPAQTPIVEAPVAEVAEPSNASPFDANAADKPAAAAGAGATAKVSRQEVRELSMLPGLGEKSAEVLVAEGVNSIHELADLAGDRQGVIERRGGQFRRLDEWIAVARKVRVLHEEYDVPLKAAAGFAQSGAWPEKLQHLEPEELQRLSREFPGFAAWLNEAAAPAEDSSSESDNV